MAMKFNASVRSSLLNQWKTAYTANPDKALRDARNIPGFKGQYQLALENCTVNRAFFKALDHVL